VIIPSCQTKEPPKAAQIWQALDQHDPAMLNAAYDWDRRPTMARASTMVAQWMQMDHKGLEWVGSCQGIEATWSFYVLHSTFQEKPADIAFEIATNAHGDVTFFNW